MAEGRSRGCARCHRNLRLARYFYAVRYHRFVLQLIDSIKRTISKVRPREASLGRSGPIRLLTCPSGIPFFQVDSFVLGATKDGDPRVEIKESILESVCFPTRVQGPPVEYSECILPTWRIRLFPGSWPSRCLEAALQRWTPRWGPSRPFSLLVFVLLFSPLSFNLPCVPLLCSRAQKKGQARVSRGGLSPRQGSRLVPLDSQRRFSPVKINDPGWHRVKKHGQLVLHRFRRRAFVI